MDPFEAVTPGKESQGVDCRSPEVIRLLVKNIKMGASNEDEAVGSQEQAEIGERLVPISYVLHHLGAENEIERPSGDQRCREVFVGFGDVVDHSRRILCVSTYVPVALFFEQVTEWLPSATEIEDLVVARSVREMLEDRLNLGLEKRDDELLYVEIRLVHLSFDKERSVHRWARMVPILRAAPVTTATCPFRLIVDDFPPPRCSTS
jgi:hypothetical protein